MGSFGGFFKGEKKKLKKQELEKKAENLPKVRILPKTEIIGKGKAKKSSK